MTQTQPAPTPDPAAPPSNAPAAPAPAPPAPAPPANGTLTQEQVNAIVANERRTASETAERKLAETLGMSPADAKARLEAATKAERAAMGEADRKLAEAADKERAADERIAQAALRERDADVRAALLDAGVEKGKIKRASQLVIGDLAGKATAEDITAAIETVKTDTPEWFGESEEGGEEGGKPPAPKSSAPSGNPTGKPPKPSDAKNPADALTRGGDRAKNMLKRRGLAATTAGSNGS